MTNRSSLAAALILLVSVLVLSMKPVASSCYRQDYGPPIPMSRKEVQWWANQRLARFAVAEHNKVLSGPYILKLVSLDDGAYYRVSPTIDLLSLDITASNGFGQAKYRAFVTESIAYDALGLECFEKM